MTGGDITTKLLKGNDSADMAESYVLSNYNRKTKKANTLFAEKSTGYLTAGVDSSRSGRAGLMYGNVILHIDDATGTTFKTMLSDVGVYRYQSYVVNNSDGSTDVILGKELQNPDITNPEAPPQNPDITNPGAPQKPDTRPRVCYPSAINAFE